ncbi:hypothetical protein [Gemmata sp.]|uniref:hypothetical protein n=1 Tax=Gemmata sp. TaxID=1914242 RepID=UPI003F6F9D17
MGPTAQAPKLPVHPLALGAFALSLVALLLASYGSLYAEKHLAGSPLREARGSAGLPAEPAHWYDRALSRGEATVFGGRIDSKVLALTTRSKVANYSLQMVAFVAPLVAGVVAALLGGWAMTAIERSATRYGGSLQAVFAQLIGSFAAVIAGCMVLSYYVWPLLPSLYTT